MKKMHVNQRILVSRITLPLCSLPSDERIIEHLSSLGRPAVRIAIGLAVMICLIFVVTPPAQSQTYKVLYNFSGFADGGNPFGGLILDARGNLYGTTIGGGVSGNGTVFRIDPNGTQTVLYSFAGGADGRSPLGDGLVLDGAGNLYGTTYYGGASDNGTVFRVDTTTGSETVLYSFTGGADGKWPIGVAPCGGNLYGSTQVGGAFFSGVVYKLTYAGNQTLYNFNGIPGDGVGPESTLTHDSSGNLYGTTAFGGAGGDGSVFKLDKNGKEAVLYSFAGGNDGANPNAGLVLDADGNLYGNTYSGGNAACLGGCGVVFKLASTGKETILHRFSGGRDGGSPYFATMIHDAAGNLFGTTSIGGDLTCNPPVGCGVVFRISKAGETVVHQFSGTDGASPYAGLSRDTMGNLYGTTYQGGTFGGGVVFKITPPGQ